MKILSVSYTSCSESLLKTKKKKKQTKPILGKWFYVNSKLQNKRDHKATFILYALTLSLPDLISNSPYYLPCDSYDISLEN